MHRLLHSCILLTVGCIILIRFYSSSTARNAALLQSTSNQNRLLRATTHGTIKHHRQQQRKRRRQRGLVVSRAKVCCVSLCAICSMLRSLAFDISVYNRLAESLLIYLSSSSSLSPLFRYVCTSRPLIYSIHTPIGYNIIL